MRCSGRLIYAHAASNLAVFDNGATAIWIVSCLALARDLHPMAARFRSQLYFIKKTLAAALRRTSTWLPRIWQWKDAYLITGKACSC